MYLLQPFLGGRTISDTLFDEVQGLAADHHIVFEQYQTSILGTPAVRLRSMTAYFMLDIPHIPWYRVSHPFHCICLPFSVRGLLSDVWCLVSYVMMINSYVPAMLVPHIYTSSHLPRASPLPIHKPFIQN